jgi:hypothetical protein
MASIRGGLLAAALSFTVLGVGQALSAQQAPILERGQRVRVSAPDVFVVQSIGVLGALTTDSVVLLFEPYRRVAIPRAAVRVIEVSRGRVSSMGPAAGVGAVAGAVIGALIAQSTYKDPCGGAADTSFAKVGCQLLSTTQGEATVGGALLGCLAGGLGGLLIGSALATERWERVPLDRLAGVRIGVTPLLGSRLGVAVSLVF